MALGSAVLYEPMTNSLGLTLTDPVSAVTRTRTRMDGVPEVSTARARGLPAASLAWTAPACLARSAGSARRWPGCGSAAGAMPRPLTPGQGIGRSGVLLADGRTTITSLAVLRDQPDLFGQVASTATAWRVLDGVDDRLLSRLSGARAAARDRVWLQADDVGRLPLSTTAAGSGSGRVFECSWTRR